jgi:hypothetical protein
MMQYLGVNVNSHYQRKWGKKYVPRTINHILLDQFEMDKIMNGDVIKTSMRDDIVNEIKQHKDSEAINFTIDSSKDPRFALMNINWFNIGVVNFMKAMGYPFSRIVEFVNQPVLLKYVEYRKRGMNRNEAVAEIGKLLDIVAYRPTEMLVPAKTYNIGKNKGYQI